MARISTEQIVYIVRKLKWTKDEIGKLNLAQAAEIFNELVYQESVENYLRQYNVASILAAIYNTIPRRGGKILHAEDFMPIERPHRIGESSEVDKLADSEGIRLPKENDGYSIRKQTL